MAERKAGLEAEQSKPDFWKNQARAQELSRELADVQADIAFVEESRKKIAEQKELLELAESENDSQTLAEVLQYIEAFAKQLNEHEQGLRFSGPYDTNDAIITIQAGAGGTDAQDWAQMLERMYLRLAEHRGWKTSMYDRAAGEEAGIKSTTFEVRGKYAYGTLRGEMGVHRLVRLSPFNADHLRQTSFARVEVLPKLEGAQVPDIDPNDLEIDTFRASGAGGQHVNKTSSAVRITHKPTGLIVQCQNQRSQGQNKAQAMGYLQAKLQLLAQEQRAGHIQELKGKHKQAAWGNQIRSYVLHPYTMVKDHRSNMETHNVQEVLDGDLGLFLGMV